MFVQPRLQEMMFALAQFAQVPSARDNEDVVFQHPEGHVRIVQRVKQSPTNRELLLETEVEARDMRGRWKKVTHRDGPHWKLLEPYGERALTAYNRHKEITARAIAGEPISEHEYQILREQAPRWNKSTTQPSQPHTLPAALREEARRIYSSEWPTPSYEERTELESSLRRMAGWIPVPGEGIKILDLPSGTVRLVCAITAELETGLRMSLSVLVLRFGLWINAEQFAGEHWEEIRATARRI